MASNYVTKIRTVNGDKQIDYNALANLPSIYTQSQINGFLNQKVDQSTFNSTISSKVTELVSGQTYTKAQTLTDSTKSLFGLAASNVPNDIFNYLGKYAKHYWKVRSASYKGEAIYKQTDLIAVESSGRDSNSTFYYSTELNFTETGEFSLKNPSSISFSYNTYTNAATLRGKYFYKGSDKKQVIYYAASNAAYAQSAENGGYHVRFDSGCGEVFSRRNYGAWEYVSDTNSNAHPKSGIVNGYEYVYLGVPFDKSIAATKIITGSYVGTGTYGEAGKNTLTFNSVPELVFISSVRGSYDHASLAFIHNASYGTTVSSSTSSSSHSISLEWNGNSVSWYYSSETYQLNVQGRVYYYAAIVN